MKIAIAKLFVVLSFAALFLPAGLTSNAAAQYQFDPSQLAFSQGGGFDGAILGYLKMVQPGRWYEQGYGDRIIDDGKNYDEVGRNANSVILWDKSRGVVLDLNFTRKVVRYGVTRTRPNTSLSGVQMRDLYKMLSAYNVEYAFPLNGNWTKKALQGSAATTDVTIARAGRNSLQVDGETYDRRDKTNYVSSSGSTLVAVSADRIHLLPAGKSAGDRQFILTRKK